jgi:hypothetical protein
LSTSVSVNGLSVTAVSRCGRRYWGDTGICQRENKRHSGGRVREGEEGGEGERVGERGREGGREGGIETRRQGQRERGREAERQRGERVGKERGGLRVGWGGGGREGGI